MNMVVITIPKKIHGTKEFITIPRKEYEEFLALKKLLLKKNADRFIEADIFRISKEAKSLKKNGKLPILRSLKNIR